MKRNKILLSIALITFTACLTSCDFLNDIFNGDDISDTKDIIGDLAQFETKFTYHDVEEIGGSTLCPSKGDVDILVVPVQFKDLSQSWSAARLDSLNVACNGNKTDGSNEYWESLSSFYKKSSYGALNLNYKICDVVIPSMTAAQFKSKADDSGTESISLIDDVYSDIYCDGIQISKGTNYSKYDSDKDGKIDGVWFIYNEFNMDNVNSDSFWAYTYWYQGSNASNRIGVFANMAAAFNYEADVNGHDAHTLIHESGHMLGLDDYYSYDNVKSAMGGLDMMDFNIGDHCAFSKFALGWVKPSLANAVGRVTLKPFEESGDCLIIPSGYFNNSAFSEYYIIDYYTPTGLCEKDAKNRYSTRDYYFSTSGVRVYHVDARLGKMVINSKGMGGFESYLSVDATKIPAFTSTDSKASWYKVAASNTRSSSYSERDLISIVNKSNQPCYDRGYANNLSLWHAGYTINSSTTSSQLNSGKWYSGNMMTTSVKIESINSDGATIVITQV